MRAQSDTGTTPPPVPIFETHVERLLLTPAEASQALGISRSKLYELLGSGVVPSVRIGSCRRIPVDDLRALVARLQSNSA